MNKSSGRNKPLAGDIYSEPEIYDAAHWWKTNDVDFITRWAEKSKGLVLELASGTGRLAVPILETGLTYTGIDLSKDYVSWARNKLEPYGENARILSGDIRTFHLEERYDFIFIGFNSFLHLLTDEDASACLSCVHEHLKETGLFLLDVFVPDPIFLYRDKRRDYLTMEFDHPQGGHCMVLEKNDYDPVTEINHIVWFFNRDGQDEPDRYEFDMRMYYPDTLDRLLTEAGLAIEHKYGDYLETPFDENSNIQIYLCQKR